MINLAKYIYNRILYSYRGSYICYLHGDMTIDDEHSFSVLTVKVFPLECFAVYIRYIMLHSLNFMELIVIKRKHIFISSFL